MSSTKKITDFYQTLSTYDSKGNPIEHEIFDYRKIWYDEEDGKNVLFYLVISERGRKAKSTQGKYLMKYIWDEYKSKSIWVMNTEKLIEKEMKSHLKKPKQFHQDRFHENMTVKGGNVYDDPADKENGWYTKFAQLSTAENEKGSRDDYELLLLDEFNVGDRNIKSIKTDLLSSLVATMDDPINSNNPDAKRLKKIIMHGNNKSLNDDFLINMGIYSIDNEITDIKVGNRVIGRILCPKMTENEKKLFEQQNEDNDLFLLQKMLGKEKHVYYNENLFDEINNVNHWMLSLPVEGKYYIRVKENYFECRVADSKDLGIILYIVPLDKSEVKKLQDEDETIVALHPSSQKEGIVYSKNLRNNFKKYLGEDLIYFHSQYIREILIPEIIK